MGSATFFRAGIAPKTKLFERKVFFQSFFMLITIRFFFFVSA